jgi:hypothetical protein
MAKMGRPRKIKDAEQLEHLWEEFKEWSDTNPLVYKETTKGPKGTFEKVINHRKAWTWQAFDTWLRHEGYIETTRDYRDNKNAAYTDFSAVITHIGEEMYQQKFAGAASGLYNANIIARDLGLVDKKQVTKEKKRMTREEIMKRIEELGG